MRFPTPSCLVQTTLTLLIGSHVAHGLTITPRATVCNGHAELCTRSFGNVTFIGAHDSYAVGTNNLATNQDYDVTQQLKDGIRMLQMQAHNNGGVINLCHTTCSLYNGGTLADYLAKVNTWLSANPSEVISILIVNSDGFQASDFDAVFQSSGIAALSYAPASSSLAASDWPTLGSLIDSGKRVLTFLDTGANFNSVPYIIDEFTNIWETAFDVTTTFDCAVNRTHGTAASQMYLINHFLDQVVLGQPAPFRAQANQTNAVSGTNSLGDQVALCESQNAKAPNFMLVDFYEFGGGSVFQVAATANGVTYAPTTPIATPLPDTSTTSTAGGGSASGAMLNSQVGSALLLAALATVGGAFLGLSNLL